MSLTQLDGGHYDMGYDSLNPSSSLRSSSWCNVFFILSLRDIEMFCNGKFFTYTMVTVRSSL